MSICWISSALLALLAPQEPPPPGTFTIVLLPDTQNYAQSYPWIFDAQTQWIRANRGARDIRYVLHLGDITNRNTAAQWNNALSSMSQLNGVVPYAMAPGNHDYGPNGNMATRDSLFDDPAYFGPGSPYATQASIGGFYEAGRTDNSFHTFRAGGRDWIILALEFGPRDGVVAWADQVLASHPNHSAIVITHAYLFHDDTRYDQALRSQSWNPHRYPIATAGGSVNDGQELWDKLIRRHPVALVCNGHVLADGTGLLSSVRDDGGVTHQMLSNYQSGVIGSANGGDGYLRLLEFYPDGKTLHVATYSPYLNQFKREPDQDFTLGLFPDPIQRSHAEAVRADAPFLYYRLEAAAGASVKNLGTGAASLDGSYSGPGPRASFFDGLASEVSSPAALARMAHWSLAAWVRSTSGGEQIVASNDRAGWNDDVLLGLAPEGAQVSTARRWALIHQDDGSASRTIVEHGADVEAGRWYHLVATSDGEFLRLYVDGRLSAEAPRSAGDLDLGGGALRVGADPAGGGRFFGGTIAEVALFDRALSATEVLEQHQATFQRVVAAAIDALGPTDPDDNRALSTAVPFSAFPGVSVPGANEGDIRVLLGNAPGFNIHDGVLLASVRQNERSGLHASVEVGRSSFGDGIQSLSITQAGLASGTNEVNFDTAVAFLPFRAGWRGAHVNADGSLAAAGGVSAAMVTPTGAGRFTLNLGVDSRSAGLLFAIGGSNGDNIAPARVLPDGSGWDVRVQDNGVDGSAGGENAPFAFTYLPLESPGLIGGRYDGVRDVHVQARGGFAMRKLRAGEYALSIDGESPQSGMLALEVSRQSAAGGGSGPLAWWPFDVDLSSAAGGARFQGAAVGAGVSITHGAGEFHRGSGALRIDGGQGANYVDITSAVIAPGQEAFTIVAWYRYRDVAGNGSDDVNYLWETSDPSNTALASGFALQGRRARAGWTLNDTAPGLLRGDNATPDDGRWHHVAVSWSRSAALVRFYWDGVLISGTPTSGAPLEPSDGLHIGDHRVGDGLRNWDGFIDDVAVFDFVVSAADISALHAGTTTMAAISSNALGAPDDKVLSYEDDGRGGFLIQARDLPALALADTEFAWAFFPWSPRDPSWHSYGAGWPGTNGVPALTPEGEARLGTAIALTLENARGAATQGLLLFALQRAALPLFGGTLHLLPLQAFALALPLPAGTFPVAIPADPYLAGQYTYFQALQVDPGASAGVSFTAGLEARIDR